jgi:hypothetical protein
MYLHKARVLLAARTGTRWREPALPGPVLGSEGQPGTGGRGFPRMIILLSNIDGDEHAREAREAPQSRVMAGVSLFSRFDGGEEPRARAINPPSHP